jgi:rRNA maturation endonuclease Nob1
MRAKHLRLDTIALKLAQPDFTLIPYVCTHCLAFFDVYKRPRPPRNESCPDCGEPLAVKS